MRSLEQRVGVDRARRRAPRPPRARRRLARAHEADEDERARRRSPPLPSDPLLVGAQRRARRRRCGRRRTCAGRRRRARTRPSPPRRRRRPGTVQESVRSRSACGRLVRGDVDRAQRLGQRRQRLHRAAHDERLAGRHAALEPAGAVGLAVVAALVGVEDLVVGLRAGPPGEVEPVADPAALDRLDRQHRHRRGARRGAPPRRRASRARARARTRAPRRRRRATRWPCAAR